jgi:hypothetical protein
MKSVLRFAAIAAILASFAGEALAADEVVEISEMSGKVLVNTGNGYAPVPDMALLNEGDTVMVGDNGSAIIVYIDTKCRVRLPARTVTTISLPDPCKNSAAIPQASSSFVSQPVTWIALGGLAFAGGIALLITSHDNEEGNPTAISGP